MVDKKFTYMGIFAIAVAVVLLSGNFVNAVSGAMNPLVETSTVRTTVPQQCYSLRVVPAPSTPVTYILHVETPSNCGSGTYVAGTQVWINVTPGSFYINPPIQGSGNPPYPCPLFQRESYDVMTGTYDLCPTATGTYPGYYMITMVRDTVENPLMVPASQS